MADDSPQGLESSSVHERSEALRVLSVHGGPKDLERLMAIAQLDESSAVRLGAAAAAADILSRYRVGKARSKIGDAHRIELLKTFKSLDPKVNPGLFLVLACVDLPRCLDRIRVGLRDPRWDVRQGAVVGLRRYCMAEAVSSDDLLRSRILGLLGPEGRLPPDALEGVIGVCAESGWEDARERIEVYRGREGSMGEAVEDALGRLDQLMDPSSLQDAWLSLGLDAGEINPRPKPRSWWVLGTDGGFEVTEGGAIQSFEWKALDSRTVSVKRKSRWHRVVLRRLWLLRSDINVAGPGLQFGDRTYYKALPGDVAGLVTLMCGATESMNKTERTARLSPLFSLLPDTVEGEILNARLEMCVGRPAAAAKQLQAIIKAPSKAPEETWYWLGEAFQASRKKAEARKAWKAYLDKAGRKSEFAQSAQERLAKK